ncbi:hypothetical protein [Catenulispora subtropica]|uniref:Integral membrane protein n=1 Tax=Catenulispora subtropica TaxID=450798 RepID=A0ABP5EA41_9ACTN
MTQDSLPVGRQADTGGTPARPPGATSAPARLRPTHPTHTMITWIMVGLGYCLIAGSLRRLTAPAELATLLPGAALVWYAQRPATPRFPAPDRLDTRAVLPWAVLLVLFGVWELYAALRGSTPAHPTLSILMGPLIDPPFARAAGYALWLAGGVWVVRR